MPESDVVSDKKTITDRAHSLLRYINWRLLIVENDIGKEPVIPGWKGINRQQRRVQVAKNEQKHMGLPVNIRLIIIKNHLINIPKHSPHANTT